LLVRLGSAPARDQTTGLRRWRANPLLVFPVTQYLPVVLNQVGSQGLRCQCKDSPTSPCTGHPLHKEFHQPTSLSSVTARQSSTAKKRGESFGIHYIVPGGCNVCDRRRWLTDGTWRVTDSHMTLTDGGWRANGSRWRATDGGWAVFQGAVFRTTQRRKEAGSSKAALALVTASRRRR